MAELAAEFRSEQDYLGECNKNRLLAAAECFAHAAIRRRSEEGIRAWMSRSGDSIQSMRRKRFVVEQTQSRNIYIFVCFDTRDRPRSKVWWVPATSVPYTDIDSFFVPGPTSQPFAGWSEVSLVW